MRSLFMTGIQNPRSTYWLGQQYAFVTSTPTDTTTSPGGWASVVSSALQAGVSAYGSYSAIEQAKEKEKAQEAAAQQKAITDRTNQIMQQTLMQQQQSLMQSQSAGMDKTILYIGAGLLGLMVIGGMFYMMSKK